MSISSAINTARSGLQINSLRADIVATNVANAATPGYVRRSVSVAETLTGGQTTGVRSNGISRSADDALSAARRGAASDLSQASVLSSTWQSLSARLGNSADGGGLFQTFSEFETALGAAAAAPESSANAAALLDTAQTIAREFNALSNVAVNMRREADSEIASGVTTVNTALNQIQDLNARIAKTDRSSAGAAALFDERQRVLDTISEYIPIQTVGRDSGTLDVLSIEGVYLVAGRARQIEFSPASSFQPEHTLQSGNLSGMSVDGVDITPGASSFGAVSSGMFGALFQLRDQSVPGFSDQLDTLASDLTARLADDSIDPSKTPGAPGLFVDPDPAAGVGLAGRLKINAVVDPAQGGALWRLRDGVEAATQGPAGNASILNNMLEAISSVRSINTNGIQGSFTSTEMAAHLSSLTGQARLSHDSVLSSARVQHNALSEAEQSETGVDIDAQMQDLLIIEQAYAANARVIEVASQMLNRLMEI